MTLPASLVRRRAVQGILVVLMAVGVPIAASSLWPEGTRYFPPPLLVLLVLLTTLNALLAWRAESFFHTLFPGHVPPVLLTSARNLRISASVGLVVSAFLAVLWLKSLI